MKMNKRSLLTVALAATTAMASAQLAESGKTYTPLAGKAQTRIATAPHGAPLKKTRGYGNPSVLIGTSFYDLQSNGSMSRRIVNHGGGRVSAVWTFSSTSDASGGSFTDRGTAYNHNPGTGWGPVPTTRVEGFRTGFTNIEAVGSSEVVVSHTAIGNGTFGTQGLFTFKNAAIGNAAFASGAVINTGNNADTILWAKTAIDGSNMYIIGCNTNSSIAGKTGLKYSKSSDNGNTWSPLVDMPGITTDSIYSIGADAYNIAARNGKVAVVCGDALTNGYIIVSPDAGATWTVEPYLRTGLQTNVNPFNFPTIIVTGDPLIDTVAYRPCPDGTSAVSISSEGNVGVTYNLVFGRRDSATTAGSYFPAYSSVYNLCYWEQGMAFNNFFVVDSFVDCDGDGDWALGSATNTFGATAQGAAYGGFGASNYSQLATVDAAAGVTTGDTMFVVYASQMDADSSTTADTGPVGQTYRDIMVSVSFNGGASWNNRVNLSNTPGQEEMFPSIARNVDGNLHIIWQEDLEPGVVLTNGDIQGDANKIKYLKISTADVIAHAIDGDRTCWDNTFIPAGITEVDANGNAIYKVYPNPAESQVTIEGNLNGASVQLINAMGQTVGAPVLAAGGKLVLDTKTLPAGLYMATITANGAVSAVRFVKK
jgi:hypothetical protein